ncbi:MAG TPA: Hpt domain-containing protein, partial [Geobacteraceae bacterium]
ESAPSAAKPSAAAPLPDSLPGIDLAAALDSLEGDTELLRQLFHTFAVDKREAWNELNQAVADGDWRKGERIAHGIKGVAGYLGSPGLASAALRLEKALEKRDEQLLPTLLAEFHTRLDEVLAAAVELERQSAPS